MQHPTCWCYFSLITHTHTSTRFPCGFNRLSWYSPDWCSYQTKSIVSQWPMVWWESGRLAGNWDFAGMSLISRWARARLEAKQPGGASGLQRIFIFLEWAAARRARWESIMAIITWGSTLHLSHTHTLENTQRAVCSLSTSSDLWGFYFRFYLYFLMCVNYCAFLYIIKSVVWLVCI